VSDSLFKRYADSAIQVPDEYPGVSNFISTRPVAIYGDASHTVGFRLGNGGAGHTGILRLLCESFITSRGGGFAIEWISNHSRHSQIALLRNIVQVALTYEPAYEDLSVREGWAKRVAKVFNDHFILVGPASNSAGVTIDGKITDAMMAIAAYGSSSAPSHDNGLFHTRGDGSATFYKELALFELAHVDLASTKSWRLTKPGTPYEALVKADRAGAYIITDRATYLTAKRDRVSNNTIPLVEGGPELLNPCSALVNTKAPFNARAREFASWLGGEEVQQIIERYGRKWSIATPIFSIARQDDMVKEERLVAKL
jgi:ABC-type tungstate transport system permease subunit